MRNQLLLIEGDPELRESLVANLRGEGFDVWTAATGLQGLSAARSLRPGLVILDLNLTDMEGQVVCRLLRGLASTAGIPLIVLHAERDGFARRFASDGGVAGCLAKPFAPEELAALVRGVLQRADGPDVPGGRPDADAALVPA